MNTATLGALADRAAAQLVALHGRYTDGHLTREDFAALALAFLDGARAQAVALADLALAAELTVLREQVASPLGLAPAPIATGEVTDTLDSERYQADAVAAITVLARATTLAAAQDATTEGMTVHGVQQWTRDPNDGACPVCTDLAAGTVPTTTPMWTHKGCGCTQRPVA